MHYGMNIFLLESLMRYLKIHLLLITKIKQCLKQIKQPIYLFIFKLEKKQIKQCYFWKHILKYYLKQDRNMQQTLKYPRCREPNPYKKVTVVPFDFGNPSTLQPALETRSSRSNSKTKIRLVSPLKKLNQTAFMSNINQPSYLSETQKSVMSPRNTVQIQLGGRNSSKNKENTLQTSQKLSKSNYNNSYLQSSQHIIQKAYSPPLVQVHQPIPVHIQSQSKMSSHNKSVHIKYTPTPFIINREPSSPYAQNKPSITFMHVRRNSSGVNISQTKPNFPTELQIREGDVIEQLKESYESELNDIKRLKQEIEQNNQEIKKLLKSSRASKEATKSKTLLEEHVEKQTVNFNKEYIKNIASIENLRLIKGPKEENQISILDYERKEKAIGSKKTLINALYFQTQEKLENIASNNNSLIQNQAVQTQEITLPLFSKHSSFQAKSSQRQFKLTLNNVCQVQCVGSSSSKLVSQPIALQDSIICQKQAVIKVQSKKHTKQQSKNKRSQKLQNIQNVNELKKQSLKMISSIKSLTKVGYDSDIKQKTQKMHQSKTSLHKIQVEDHLENTLPVSQKSIKLEKQKSQATIPLVIQTKKNEVKVPETNLQTKQNSMMDKQANKTWSLNNKIEQLNVVVNYDTQQPKSTVVNPKKGRKINNSIYL